MVARRHSYQTGTTRTFAAYVDALTRDTVALEPPPGGASGAMLLCLPVTQRETDEFIAWAKDGPPAERAWLVVGVAQRAGRLGEPVFELRCA